MSQTVRCKRFPIWAGCAAALTAFTAVALAAALALDVGLVRPLAAWDAHFFIGLVLPTMLLIALLTAYAGARLIYTAVRWRRISCDGPVCRECAYNLTGNVSGRCPECGIEFT